MYKELERNLRFVEKINDQILVRGTSSESDSGFEEGYKVHVAHSNGKLLSKF